MRGHCTQMPPVATGLDATISPTRWGRAVESELKLFWRPGAGAILLDGGARA